MLVTAIPADNKMVAWGLIVVAVILVTFWVSWALRIFYRELKDWVCLSKEAIKLQGSCLKAFGNGDGKILGTVLVATYQKHAVDGTKL